MGEPGEGPIPVGHCARCGREVLAVLAFDASGLEGRACLHCDAALDPDALRWLGEADLDAVGYGAYPEAKACGSGGCGAGGCGRRA